MSLLNSAAPLPSSASNAGLTATKMAHSNRQIFLGSLMDQIDLILNALDSFQTAHHFQTRS